MDSNSTSKGATPHIFKIALSAMPVGTVREPLQALANVCERIVQEAFDAVEELNAIVNDPPPPPSPPAPNN